MPSSHTSPRLWIENLEGRVLLSVAALVVDLESRSERRRSDALLDDIDAKKKDSQHDVPAPQQSGDEDLRRAIHSKSPAPSTDSTSTATKGGAQVMSASSGVANDPATSYRANDYIPTTPQLRQAAEDFDWDPSTLNTFNNFPTWEQIGNGTSPNNYGYKTSNNLASVNAAPGELGGSISRQPKSYFADNVTCSGTLLDLVGNTLTAEGWAKFTATNGNVCIGWFNGSTYINDLNDTVPDNFIGWRNSGATVYSSLGTTGTGFSDGSNARPFTLNTPFYWVLTYDPSASTYGRISLRIGSTAAQAHDPATPASTRDLTSQQRSDLSSKKFDHFGIVTPNTGSQTSVLYLDNLIYTKLAKTPVMPANGTPTTQFFDVQNNGWGGYFYDDPDPNKPDYYTNKMPHTGISVREDYKWQSPSTGIGRSGAGAVGGKISNAIGKSYYAYDYDPQNNGTGHVTNASHLVTEGYLNFPSPTGLNAQLGWTNKNLTGWREANTLALRFTRDGSGSAAHINVALDVFTANYGGDGIGDQVTGSATLAVLPVSASTWSHYRLEYTPGTIVINGTTYYASITYSFDGIDPATGTPMTYADTRYMSGGFNHNDGQHQTWGANFDLFGLFNHKIPASGTPTTTPLTIYLDDLTNTVDGNTDPSSNDFASDPNWAQKNNSFGVDDSHVVLDYVERPKHEFAWSGDLEHLDGGTGYSQMYTVDSHDRHAGGGVIYLADFGIIEFTTKAGYDLWVADHGSSFPPYPPANDPATAAYYNYVVLPPNDVAYAYYGANLGPRDANANRLFVTGKIKLDFAETDGGEAFGWFKASDAIAGSDQTDDTWQIRYKIPNSANNQVVHKGDNNPVNFIGMQINGGGSHGYSIMPSYNSTTGGATNNGHSEDTEDSYEIQWRRAIEDGKWRDFYLELDPHPTNPHFALADPQDGSMICQIQNQDGTPGKIFEWEIPKASLDGISFDTFGFVTMRKGGGKPAAVFVDKLVYNVAP